MAERVVSEPAPAKINPFLRVLRRRDDGFHDIETLVLPVTLADGVRAERSSDITLTVAGEATEAVPTDDTNLVVRAARELRARYEVERGARLLLAKRIPVAAGLGGGSSDAAATLRALNDLWECALTAEELVDVAAAIGSDVPALIRGGPAIARGRGEVVESVDLPRTWWVILAASGVHARDAYEWCDEGAPAPGPDVGPLLEALRAGDLDGVAEYLLNDLEAPVAMRRPEVAHARRRLLEAGAVGTVMCGSGPSVAALARDGSHAEVVARASGGTAVSSLRG